MKLIVTPLLDRGMYDKIVYVSIERVCFMKERNFLFLTKHRVVWSANQSAAFPPPKIQVI